MISNVATKFISLYFQMLTNVPKDNTTAVLMLCATTVKDRTTVHANMDILEMDWPAQVNVLQHTHEDLFRLYLNLIMFTRAI